MTLHRPARRRFIQISAACSGAALLAGMGFMNRASAGATQAGAPTAHFWTGIALGADASLQISHPDAKVAQTLIERCVAEVQRLESLFSLYRSDSALATLNRQGYLDAPAGDFLTLLNRSTEFSRLTDGMFDITVQPLWQAYADFFSGAGDASIPSQVTSPSATGVGDGMPPPLQAAIHEALQRVNWRELDIDTQKIQLRRPGMAITLNGIAQGYITDRITQLLAANGIDHALVNMGELYGLNPELPASTPPWQVGLEDAQQAGNIARRIPVHNQAVATSGAYGTPFTADLRHNHLLDPRRGSSSHRYRSVSVVADDATTADALSTAFALMAENDIRTLSQQLGVKTYIQAANESGVREV